MEKFWKNRKIFITGANGFLGSHLTQFLLKSGNRPSVLIFEENPGSIFDTEKLELHTNVIRGDVRDIDLLIRIFKEEKIDTVFHLAAQAIVDQALDDPLHTFETNIQGTWNILEAARRVGGMHGIIVASSDKAYGHHDDLPYEEHKHHLGGLYPYEVSKSCADLLSHSYWKTFKLPVVITRSTNFYGPGDLKLNRIVPNTIRKIHYGERPVIRDSAEYLRDYLFIDDVVAGYCGLAENMGKEMYGHAFNLATNRPLSVLEVIKIIASQMGGDVEPEIITTRGFEISKQYASYQKIKNVIGWEPRHTFEEGIAKTVPWYVNYFKKLNNGKA